MKEFRSIVEAYGKLDYSARKAALATVVKVRGSSYRSPGARMLITDDGRWVGSISGGCLEGDALRKARKVILEGKPMTVTYDTREESNQNLGISLGCNGVIDVLIEPIDHNSSSNPVRLFETFVHTREPVALATVFRSENEILTGQKVLAVQRDSASAAQRTLADKELTARIATDLSNLFETHSSETRTYEWQGTQVDVYLELIPPNISMIIFGGGFDARPVSALAKSLGWEVTVTDECAAHIAPLFFPGADNLSLCSRTYIERDFDITPFTACVLMSHNYEYDRDVLRTLLKTPAPYIGMLGPRKRFDKMREEFDKEGIVFSSEDMHRIHSPIGLDIGAETPDEIAVSIIAEIQSKFTCRSGGFLKYRQGPIHKRGPGSDQVFKEVHLNPVLRKTSEK
ncbi:MAG TPA: XdhC/CoxI family protein [Cyclobacteriaceae bacterium]|nr:XdhC/CoxI family protein [Cyclobacteriaceae bacterium]